MKHLGCSALVVLLLTGLPVLAQQSDKAKTKSVKFDLEVRGTIWGVPHYLPQISNVPAALRQIPGHKDDFPSGGATITVPDASINPQQFVSVGGAAAPGITIREKVSLRFGVNWGIPFSQSAHTGNTGNTREVNLQGTSERGTGRSLVYYSAQFSAARHPGVFGEVETKVSNRYSVLLGYRADYYDLTIERGWDRFNKLQRLDRRHFASGQMHAPYVGFRIFETQTAEPFSIAVFGGLVFTRLTPGPLAASASIGVTKPSVLLGVSIGKTFAFKRKGAN